MSPHRPTRDDASSSTRTDEMLRGGGGAPSGLGKERQEHGSAAENAKYPPHLTPNAEDAPIQDNHPQAGESPVRPANASGQDKLSSTEHQQGIDEESMYDGRPEEDKERPPSSPSTA